jgi:hypothetical protein
MTKNGALDGTTAVYTHEAGDMLTEIFLPVSNGKLYRIEATKMTSLSRLKIFTSVPRDATTLDKNGYENIEVSATDSTKAIFYVGTANTDHTVRRTSGSNLQDQVAPTFAVSVPIVPSSGRRRAVQH